MLDTGLRYLLLWKSPSWLCSLEWDMHKADCSGLKRAVKALACQEKHFLLFTIYSSLLSFPALAFVYIPPLAHRPRPSPSVWSSDPPWSDIQKDFCFFLTDSKWEEAKAVVKVQLGVRVVDLCFRGFGIQKVFSSRRWKGNSSCQWVVLAPPVLVSYILVCETKLQNIPKILPVQQNQGGVWHC